MKSKTLSCPIIVLMLVLLLIAPLTNAQTDSLAVWENIADGTLINTWYEVDDANWKGQNDSGVWEYNNSMVNGVNFTINASIAGTRWFKTYEFMSEDDEYGIGDIIAYNSETDWYGVMYWLNGPDDAEPADATPACYIVEYVGNAVFYYWNGTDFEWNVSNATDYSNDWEKPYTSSWVRVKSLVNHNESNDWCTIRWKIWEPTFEEPIWWMVDTNVTINNDNYPQGLCVDGTEEPALQETDFRRIFFWNLSYEMTTGLNSVINCPTMSAYDFANTYAEYYDSDDIYNSTQMLKDFLNLFDLTSFYSEAFWGNASNQNDTTYHFTNMMTDTRTFMEDFFGPDVVPDDFPDNILYMRTYETIDGSSNESDYMLLRIDSDNNQVYDSYDYAFWSNDTDTIGYQGWTEMTDEELINYCMMWSGPSDGISEIFRDELYYCWAVLLNWDAFYNGSSGNRIMDDQCRMSISWYDNDTDALAILQDFYPSDDDQPYIATEQRNVSLDPVWEGQNVSQFWVLFQVDEDISGEPLADPEDSIYQDIDQTTQNLVQVILPILISIALIIAIISIALSTGFTKEGLITILIITVLGIVVISIITNL